MQLKATVTLSERLLDELVRINPNGQPASAPRDRE